MITNENNTDKKTIEYSFIAIPKKINMYLDINQRAMFALLIDYQKMTKKEWFSISISYICKNLDIANMKAQKIINELILINCISKKVTKGQTNEYTINSTLVNSFNEKTNEEIFILREEKKMLLKNNKQTTTEAIEAVTEVAAHEQDTIQEEIIEAVTEEQEAIQKEPAIEEIKTIQEEKIITINNYNMEQNKEVISNDQEKTTEKQVINEYQFGILLEQNGINKRMIHLVNVYEKLGLSKMMNSEKEEYNNYIIQYNSLLSNYQLIIY
ncbi:hypothetical protein [uncultured Bacteroides sp.]|uniref:hypothetical protein n=1 Tax=uncultured Bacteroides sp. TaxID=162156 RepID=UPI002AA7508B|nr:hypothetical protein [uncultured Bacteroides sp.]